MSGWRHALSWFPGHVAAARREMTERLRHVDIVLEVRDARAPLSTASAHLHAICRDARKLSRRLIVVNKSDLASTEQHRDIVEWLSHEDGAPPCFFTVAADTPDERMHGGARGVPQLLDAAIDLVRETTPRVFAPSKRPVGGPAPSEVSRAISAAAYEASGLQNAQGLGGGRFGGGGPGGERSLPLIMMVVGVPNVGKSSLINAFRRLAVQNALNDAAGDEGAPRVPMRARSRKPARTGPLPGVTTSLSGFQVSWNPAVWVLDTPGVLSPKVDGGWEAALRLGCFDLIKYGPDSLEALGAYALHFLAETQPSALARWPSVARAVERRRDGREKRVAAANVEGFGPDPLNSRGQHAWDRPSANDTAACSSERFGMSLLGRAARDMGLKQLGKKKLAGSDGRRSREADTYAAAGRVLKLLRDGELGRVCFDAFPLELEARRKRERLGLDDQARGSAYSRRNRRQLETRKRRIV